nr:hypothetical protein [Bifidobacterium myosotis]
MKLVQNRERSRRTGRAARFIAPRHRIGRPWISRRGLIVCPGVTIGDNSAIGAGSVVAKDIPENGSRCE